MLKLDNPLISRLFIITAVAEAIPSLLDGYREYVGYITFKSALNTPPVQPTEYIPFIVLARNVLSPLLPFLLIYFLYTPHDLKKTYVNIIITLFIAALTGGFIGFTLGLLSSSQFIQASPQPEEIRFLLISDVIASIPGSLYTVFLGFTAATIAYIRRRWSTSATE